MRAIGVNLLATIECEHELPVAGEGGHAAVIGGSVDHARKPGAQGLRVDALARAL